MERHELPAPSTLPFGELLKTLRKRRGVRQQALAEQLGVHRNTIGIWERGDGLPDRKSTVLELARVLRLDEQETRWLFQASLTALSPFWYVPFPRNPFFTGRQTLLARLHQQLSQTQAVALSQSYALSGLGGIGKTQLALEYAYQYVHEYHAVFWVASETLDTLSASYTTIAALLQLPQAQEADQSQLLSAVKRWFSTHKGWLLIFDNVEDLSLLQAFLPAARQGAVLITTRLHALEGLAHPLELAGFTQAEALQFLMLRARLADLDFPLEALPTDVLTAARALVETTDGLPLALEQAGAYLERTGCSLVEYLHLFQHYQARLLAEPSLSAIHPHSVVQTFSLSFEMLVQTNPAAINLLRLCAFLHPDAIPEKLIRDGIAHWSAEFQHTTTDLFAFDQMIAELQRFSLVKRSAANKILSLHRLVQVVLHSTLDEEEQSTWAERAVLTVNAAFPDVEQEEQHTWSQCELVLPHALLAAQYIKIYQINAAAAARLLSQTAYYLKARARYSEAEPIFRQAVHMQEQNLGNEHPVVARLLTGLADMYLLEGEYGQAEPLFRRALSIVEQSMGTHHADVAPPLNGLAVLYNRQGKYGEAEPLYQRTLSILGQSLGSQHSAVATALNGLANLYYEQCKYNEAEPLYQRALFILEQKLGPEHPQVADSLNGLAYLYKQQGKYEEAGSLFQRALFIWQHTLGIQHPAVVSALTGLAHVYREQGKYEQAEFFYQHALSITEQNVGPEHPQVAYLLRGLGQLSYEQGNYERGETLYRRALSIVEQSLGSAHPLRVYLLTGVANIYTSQGADEEAEQLYRQAISMCEQQFGPEHLDGVPSLAGLANLYRKQGKYLEAEPFLQRALCIREHLLGTEHPETAKIIYDLAQLRAAQGRYDEARSWFTRALAVLVQVLGEDHPYTAEARQRFVSLLPGNGAD